MIGPVAAGTAVTGALVLGAVALRIRDRASVRAAVAVPLATTVRTSPSPDRRVRPLVVLPLAVIVALVAFALAGAAGSVAAAVAVLAVPSVRARRRAATEAAALQDGLADAVSAIASAIRAGRSMAGALAEAAATVPPPLEAHLARLVDRVSLGLPVERAVQDLATSVPGPDGRLVSAVLGLHHRSGGDAPAVLDRVAGTLRERRAAAREVRSLTAQARLSGAILGFLPIGFFLFLSVTARADVERALGSTTGRTAVVVGLVMQAVAFLWIKRLLRVEA